MHLVSGLQVTFGVNLAAIVLPLLTPRHNNWGLKVLFSRVPVRDARLRDEQTGVVLCHSPTAKSFLAPLPFNALIGPPL